MISADIQHMTKPLDQLTLDPENTRLHSDENIRAIAESLRVFGQQTPITCNSNGMVLKGNGTLLAAQLLGWTEIAVSMFDIGDEHQVGYAIQDNKAGELAEWDYRRLAAKLPLLQDQYNLEEMGWKKYEIEPILEATWGDKDKGDRPIMKTVQLTDQERESFDQAVRIVRDKLDDKKVSEGRVLELLCGDYLAGV